VVEPQRRSGRCEVKKSVLFVLEIEPRLSSQQYLAITTELSCLFEVIEYRRK
jgi:hypothetical protein